MRKSKFDGVVRRIAWRRITRTRGSAIHMRVNILELTASAANCCHSAHFVKPLNTSNSASPYCCVLRGVVVATSGAHGLIEVTIAESRR
jgi:hypothetical protein